MVLLIFKLGNVEVEQLKIYIPIWFYLYKKVPNLRTYLLLNLHSNMVLLIFVCILSLSYVKAYLHSNMVLLIFTLLFF